MSPQDFNGDAAAVGDTLATDVVITATATADTATAAAPGEKNGRWFRYVVISISVFISHNVGDNDQDDEAPAPPPPEESLEQINDQSDHVIEMSPRVSAAGEEVRARVVDGAPAPPPPPEQLNGRSDHVIDMSPRVGAAGGEARARVSRIVKERDHNALRRLGGVDRVVSLQRSYFEVHDSWY